MKQGRHSLKWKVLTVPLATLLLAASAVALSPAAQASTGDDIAYNGADYGGVTHKYETIYACDREADGNGVYTEFYMSGSSQTFEISDGNGSADPSCGRVSSGFGEVTKFRVCERGKWCTRWYTH
ncbi:hypothetical protein AB0D32_15025 [Micromonospora sp. NPDC048170]|uniref:hypothetical protein n=1 Tax=Micromonospora sp. NPDC048170 TaxID=3154819 RepID=UPI0033E83D71